MLHAWDNALVRDNDGRTLDHWTLEVLRMRAVARVVAGPHSEGRGGHDGFHKNTVDGWLAWVRAGGMDALKAKLVPARPYKLGPQAISRTYESNTVAAARG